MMWFHVAIKTLREVARRPVAAATSLGLPLALMVVFGIAFTGEATPPVDEPVGNMTASPELLTGGIGTLASATSTLSEPFDEPTRTLAPEPSQPRPAAGETSGSSSDGRSEADDADDRPTRWWGDGRWGDDGRSGRWGWGG